MEKKFIIMLLTGFFGIHGMENSAMMQQGVKRKHNEIPVQKTINLHPLKRPDVWRIVRELTHDPLEEKESIARDVLADMDTKVDHFLSIPPEFGSNCNDLENQLPSIASEQHVRRCHAVCRLCNQRMSAQNDDDLGERVKNHKCEDEIKVFMNCPDCNVRISANNKFYLLEKMSRHQIESRSHLMNPVEVIYGERSKINYSYTCKDCMVKLIGTLEKMQEMKKSHTRELCVKETTLKKKRNKVKKNVIPEVVKIKLEPGLYEYKQYHSGLEAKSFMNINNIINIE